VITRELEHLVLGIRSHEIGSRADVRRVRAFSDKLELQGVATSRDTVGAFVVCSVYGAIGGTRFIVFARGSVPFIASVAVGVPKKA
jgi:hypothetical protein